jgi:hypothetical protein
LGVIAWIAAISQISFWRFLFQPYPQPLRQPLLKRVWLAAGKREVWQVGGSISSVGRSGICSGSTVPLLADDPIDPALLERDNQLAKAAITLSSVASSHQETLNRLTLTRQ